MKTVVCWCCEHFSARFDDSINKERITSGECKLHNTEHTPEDIVCEDFLLMQGLFTERGIPEYCKNYNGKPIKKKKIPLNFHRFK